jgi:hypothetical protein
MNVVLENSRLFLRKLDETVFCLEPATRQCFPKEQRTLDQERFMDIENSLFVLSPYTNSDRPAVAVNKSGQVTTKSWIAGALTVGEPDV